MNKIQQLIQQYCPNGVEFKELGEVVKIQRGVRVVRNQLLKDGKYPVYQNSMKPLGYFEKYNYKANTTFIISAGAAGDVGYSDVDFWAADDCFLCICRDNLRSKFLYYILLCNQTYLYSRVRRASVPRISREAISKLQIPIPPLQIQQEIVKILDSFTQLEAELEAELEARRAQYEYYRNQLLNATEVSGKWLMNGVEVEWKTLGEVGEFVRGSGLQKNDFTKNGVGCIHYGQIYTFYGFSANKTKSFVSPELATKLRKAKKGDLVIATTSENIEDVCKAVVWLGNEEICISGETYIFKHTQNAKFIAHYLRTPLFLDFKKQNRTGTKVIRVHGDKLKKFQIPIPPIAEQNRIVEILDKFDSLVNDISIGLPAEIDGRRKQYNYYRGKLLDFKPMVSDKRLVVNENPLTINH